MWKSILACALLCVATLFIVDYRLARLTTTIERLVSNVEQLMTERVQRMQPTELYAAWYSAGTPPVFHELTTVKRPTETDAQWRARHLSDLAAAWDKFPPV